MSFRLPIDDVLPELIAALGASGVAVLQAPPGAGKTTGVPPALLDSGIVEGRIVMLEPRRLAARAAAERIAKSFGEEVGQRVGFRIRGEARVSKATRIEVVTEGVLSAMLQSDPSLSGVGAVIFDEFHERSLHGDLGLALTWEARGALREDLKVLVMSATLDASPVAELLGGAPVITSAGRAFPVETRWLERPLPAKARLEGEVVGLIREAMLETGGGILVFLPGAGEIARVAGLIEGELGPGVTLHRLFGAADPKAQRAAVAPEKNRKLVLATAIAETSLTISGIEVVVDAGLARRARFDAGRGMTRLVTERASRAEADQRRGRAGREAPGICYRLWAKAEEGAMPVFAPPEIETGDLAALALNLAVWGSQGGDLAFLTPPPAGAMAKARGLLARLGAIDDQGRITAHGRDIAALPLHPRLAHMLAIAGASSAPVAALLGDRDPLMGARAPVDLDLRLKAIAGDRTYQGDPGTLARIRAETRRLARRAGKNASGLSPGAMAALAFPDRIGKRRAGDAPRWQLSGGTGAVMAPGEALAGADYLVAIDTDGERREARIRMAAPIGEDELRELFAGDIRTEQSCTWSRREGRIVSENREMLFELVLRRDNWRDPPKAARAGALAAGLNDKGLGALGFSGAAERLRTRIGFARTVEPNLPDLSEKGLLASVEVWFTPNVGNARNLEDLQKVDWAGAFLSMLDWGARQSLDRAAPKAFQTPLGRAVPIDYAKGGPRVSLRLQEVFGLSTHPSVAGQAITLELLSPAGRPLQVTQDLPGFWANTYADVRRDMRGRYPKHPWPEDPSTAQPTTRVKPRR